MNWALYNALWHLSKECIMHFWYKVFSATLTGLNMNPNRYHLSGNLARVLWHNGFVLKRFTFVCQVYWKSYKLIISYWIIATGMKLWSALVCSNCQKDLRLAKIDLVTFFSRNGRWISKSLKRLCLSPPKNPLKSGKLFHVCTLTRKHRKI